MISARKEEFERAYKKSGHTREHVRLAKSLGVTKLLVVVNKMDYPPVNWSIERCLTTFLFKNTNLIPHFLTAYFFPRYQEIVSKMTPVLKSSGYNVEEGKWILISFSITLFAFFFYGLSLASLHLPFVGC